MYKSTYITTLYMYVFIYHKYKKKPKNELLMQWAHTFKKKSVKSKEAVKREMK